MGILEGLAWGRDLAGARNRRRIAIALAVLGLSLGGFERALFAQEARGAPPRLDKTEFEARRRNEAILTVERFGRYSVIAISKQGTSLQLVDRMAGPGAVFGEAGKEDGRMDLLLDGGTYKVVANSHEKGQGKLTLAAKAFAEINAPQAPVLADGASIEGKLEDFQQVSYWLEIKERQWVYLEAQGRDLKDLRLWFEGNWLVDAEPEVTECAPASGRPETNCVLIEDLTPGTYLVTAYGGKPNPWPAETGQHPFHIRYGLPLLEANARSEGEVSLFGCDRFLVPKPANYFLLQLPQKKDFRLEAKSFNRGDALGPWDYVATISKKSQDPECRIEGNPEKDFMLVTVTGSPGEPYVFQCFEKKESYTFHATGNYWIGTLHSGYMDDNIDATAILVSSRPQGAHVEAEASDVIHVGDGKTWARRFNLLEDETLFFFVEEPGDYEIRSSGTDVQFRFEPFMLTRPEGYKTPEFRGGGSAWPMDRGYWVLTLSPKLKGIAVVEVRRKGGAVPFAAGLPKEEPAIQPGPAKGACQFPSISLDTKYTYTLYTNIQEGVDHGVVLRSLSPDLRQPLPVVLKPGEEITLTGQVVEAGKFTVSAVAGAGFNASVDGTACGAGCAAGSGDHKFWLKNTGEKTQIFSLKVTPARLVPGAPPPPLPTEVSQGFAKFPTFTESAPLFVDFDRGEKKSVLLDVDKPGLYRIETTGLLATACAVRTRTKTKLFTDESGGIGRNCLVQQYLKDGEYQVTFKALGQSKGHAGLFVRRASVTDGGALALGKDSRENVPAGSAVQYGFQIPSQGRYKISTIGTGKTFRCRFEDREGWPLLVPNALADLTLDLAPAPYRYMTLPWDVDTLRCTRVEEVPPPRKVEGHGPHALALNERLENLWREPEKEVQRQRDIYEFAVPADVDAHVALGEEQMQAYVARQEGGRSSVLLTVPPGKEGWSGKLSPGSYRLEVECSRPNDRLAYAVSVTVDQLVPGLSREVMAPGTVPVSVSRAGVVELASHGTLDVRGRLFKMPEKTLVDSSDDAYNDWNFRIARKLEPGSYALLVDPVGSGKGPTTISMSAPEEFLHPAVTLPAESQVELNGKINLFPMTAPSGGGVLSVKAAGDSFLGLVVEKGEGDAAKVIAQRTGRSCEVDVPVEPGGRYQVRLWSADHQVESARLRVSLTNPPPVSAESLQGGDGPRVAEVASAGTFLVEPSEGFSFSTGIDEPLVEPVTNLISLPAGRAYVDWSSGAAKGRLQRLTLKPGAANAMKLNVAGGRPWWLDVAGDTGSVSVLTARGEPGSPACAFLSGKGPDSEAILSRSYAIFESGSAAVSLGGASKAVTWSTDPRAPAFPGFEVRLDSFPKPAGQETTAVFGTNRGEIKSASRTDITLPPGPKHLDMSLEKGLMAVAWEDSRAVVAACAQGEPVRQSLNTEASRLTLLNLTDSAALYSLDLLKAQAPHAQTELAAGALYEEVFARPGVVTLKLSGSLKGAPGLDLYAEGKDLTCSFMDETGRLCSGHWIALNGHTGIVTLSHAAGLVKAWVASEKDALAVRWGGPALAAPTPVQPNSMLAVEGASEVYQVDLTAPSVLSFGLESPAVAGLAKSSGEWLMVREGSEACAFDFYLEAGSYLLGIRALKGGTLNGRASLRAAEVVLIAGIFGPETLLGGGESRTFAFTVQEKGLIGVGLKTDRETLDSELLTRDEKPLMRGIQQFAVLEVGTYLLRVTNDTEAEPVRFAPVVVGLQKPSEGPPDEVLQEFLKTIGAFEEGR